MTECQKFFESLEVECEQRGSSDIRGARLREEGSGRLARLIDWESQRASTYSPCPVEAGELIRKALYSGQEVVEGALHRNAFSPLVDIGLSADRTSVANGEESRVRFKSREKEQKPLYGYLDIEVNKLRSCMCGVENGDTPQRAVVVYDTATQTNTSHSEAFLIVKVSNSRPIKTIQADLLDTYKESVRRYSF